MARLAKDGLSKHTTKGYRISLGKKPDGNAKNFWLGHNRTIAEYHADTLKGQFESMKVEGRNAWSDQDIATVNWYVGQFKLTMNAVFKRHQHDLDALERKRQELEGKGKVFAATFAAEAPTTATAPAAPASGSMLHATLDTYQSWYEAKADKSPSGKARLGEIVESLKRVHADIAISRIDRLWLDTATQYWKNRPPHRKTGKPISSHTVRTVLQILFAFIVWLSDNEDSTGFNEPKKWQKLFKYRADEIDDIEQLTLDEIKTLYTAATDQQKLYLLAGLMHGMTQTELACTTKDEFNFDRSIWTHRRHKTNVMGSHWMAPEFSKLVKARIGETPDREDNLAFVTTNGLPLVSYVKGKKLSDAVRQSWDDLLKKAKLTRHVPYKMCRKFCASWIKDHYSEELAEVAIQHKGQSVLNRHYARNRNFHPLYEAQQAMYQELKMAGVFGKVDMKIVNAA